MPNCVIETSIWVLLTSFATDSDAVSGLHLDAQVGGWTLSWGNLTFATVRGAGHMVPATQPARALQLFASFLSGTSLPS